MTDQEILELFGDLFIDLDDFGYLLEQKPLLAHYTSIHVLEKIITSDELWFSNPLFMNDLEEMKFGVEHGTKWFRQLNAEIKQAAGSSERFSVINSAFDHYYRKFSEIDALDVYVFCLTEHKHPHDNEDGVLSMWRAYGGNGDGAALVFRTDFLTGPNNSSPLIIAKVSYGSSEKRLGWLQQRIRDWCKILEGTSIPDDKLWLAAHSIFSAIKVYALTSKHRGFSEENEWRLIYLPDRDPNGIMKNDFKYIVGKRGVEPKLRFKITPMPLENPESWTFDSILHRIILGPSLSSALARASVARMLQLIGKADFKSRVVSSGIPLRPS